MASIGKETDTNRHKSQVTSHKSQVTSHKSQGTSRNSQGSDRHAEQLLHRLKRTGQLFPIPSEAEADVTFAVGAEVYAGHAADAAVLDQVLDHPPGNRFARTALP